MKPSFDFAENSRLVEFVYPAEFVKQSRCVEHDFGRLIRVLLQTWRSSF